MVFDDYDYIIYNKFVTEFTKFLFDVTDKNLRDGMYFNHFLESKDLGIISLSYMGHRYKVVDEKKWIIAKIKYGF